MYDTDASGRNGSYARKQDMSVTADLSYISDTCLTEIVAVPDYYLPTSDH